jgi:hypothetical protein
MSELNIFEVASRNKFRFSFKGIIPVEDLWDLQPRQLDSIFQTLNAELKLLKEESLLDAKTKQDKELELKIEIIKYIVQIKLEEQADRAQALERKEKKQKILEILSTKQEEDLKGKTPEELQKMLEEL